MILFETDSKSNHAYIMERCYFISISFQLLYHVSMRYTKFKIKCETLEFFYDEPSDRESPRRKVRLL